MFSQLGAAVIDADEATHAVYEPGTPGFEAIVREFGRRFVKDGAIDRASLGDLVFKDERARERLNAIVHPLVRQWMAERTAEAVEGGAEIVIHDVPLLFENKLQAMYSATVLVYAQPATQVARLTEQRGLTHKRANGMLASQMRIDDKTKVADFVIDNDGDLDATRRQVAQVWTSVRAL